MNAKGRESLNSIVESLNKSLFSLQNVLDREQDSFDNIPENLLSSERFQNMEENIDDLTEATELISSAQELVLASASR